MNVNWNSPDFEGFAGQNPFQRSQNGPRPIRKPIGTPLTRTVINLLVTLLFAAVYFYVTLPALNFKSGDLYVFLLLVCASILLVKQHLIVDIPTGVVASEIPLQLARRFKWERLGFAIEERLSRKKGQ